MNDQQRNDYLAKYSRQTHLLGRLTTGMTLMMLLGAPFLIGWYLGALPNLAAVGKTFLSVGLVWTASGVVEFLIYTPMLGSGGSYLAFITGNLINMKIPCAMNAKDMVSTKSGTPENEIISTLSIAASSLVTTVVLAVGVMALAPLQPILQSPALAPAFTNVVPALFGAMGYQYFRKNLKLAAVPLILMSVLFVALPSLTAQTSLMMIPAGALTILIAYIGYRRRNTVERSAEV